MKAIEAVMKWPLVYRLWMATHSDQKFLPILKHNSLGDVRRVLDVGCGPGTNAPQFSNSYYLGIDWNERYIRRAQDKYKGNFIVGDVTKFQVSTDEKFDFILINSLLHHLDKEATKRLLAHLPTLLTEDGYIHIIELILPPNFSVPWLLARADRGEFPRPTEEWHRIFNEFLSGVVFEPFDVGCCGLTLWELIYFKGRAKGLPGLSAVQNGNGSG
jgi:SAM-dependent methyltransferase